MSEASSRPAADYLLLSFVGALVFVGLQLVYSATFTLAIE